MGYTIRSQRDGASGTYRVSLELPARYATLGGMMKCAGIVANTYGYYTSVYDEDEGEEVFGVYPTGTFAGDEESDLLREIEESDINAAL